MGDQHLVGRDPPDAAHFISHDTGPPVNHLVQDVNSIAMGKPSSGPYFFCF